MSATQPAVQPHGFFFLGGAHKSGTTWIMRMLNSHPQCGVVGEAAFVGFKHGVDAWFDEEQFRAWGSAAMRQKLWLKGLDVEEVTVAMKRGMIEALMRQRFTGPQVQMYGDKTPHFYNVHADELFRLFPDGKFIDIIRDGRDVAVSHMFHMLRKEYEHGAKPEAEAVRRFHVLGEGERTPLFLDDALSTFVRKWKRAVEGGHRLQELYGDAYLLVRYEDVIADPRGQLERMLAHLGVRHSDYIVGHCVDQHTFEKASGRKRGEGDPNSFFRKGVAGDWVHYFGDEDKRLFKERAGDLLVKHGYAPDLDW